MKRCCLFSLLIITVLCCSQIVWGVPRLINYQGKITDSQGRPIAAVLSMTFKLYASDTGGEALWTEQQNVDVREGIYSVLLGSIVALPPDLIDNLYLEIRIHNQQTGTAETLSPRSRLTSTPFALKAETAENISGPVKVNPSTLKASDPFTYSNIPGLLIGINDPEGFPLDPRISLGVDGTIRITDLSEPGFGGIRFPDGSFQTTAAVPLEWNNIAGKPDLESIYLKKNEAGSITTSMIAQGAVTGGNLADGSITGGKIIDGSIQSADLAEGSVTGAKLAEGSVTPGKIQGVGWTQILDMPGGFADGMDNDTTYTAGQGLSLSGTQFSVNFAGNGALTSASRSDHAHSDYISLSGGTFSGDLINTEVANFRHPRCNEWGCISSHVFTSQYYFGSTSTSPIQIGEDNPVSIPGTLRAKRFYDIDNVTYVVNPASSTNLNLLNVNEIATNGLRFSDGSVQNTASNSKTGRASLNVKNLASWTHTNMEVDFGFTFAASPVVTITGINNEGNMLFLMPQASNITTKGFTLVLVNPSPQTCTGTYSINWAATSAGTGTLTTWYKDADGDGYSDGTSQTREGNPPTGYYLESQLLGISGDCNDITAAFSPGVSEVCDGVDNDCDGQIDEGVLITFYLDADSDGYGDPAVSVVACAAPPGYVTDNRDCDDTNGDFHPDAAEICDGLDNNCNDQIDDGCES